MTVYEEYLQLDDKANNAENDKDYEKYAQEAVSYRDKNFSKSDWEQLIKDAGSSRAKYEYTRMMNEKFSK